MENTGDWIYLLLILAAGVSGLVSSVKKKKQKDQSEPPQPSSSPNTFESKDLSESEKDFWDFLHEKLEEQAAPVPKDTSFKPQSVQERKVTSASRREKLQIPQTRQQTTIKPFEEELSFWEEEPFKDPEELRKAIIYTEILNRKY